MKEKEETFDQSINWKENEEQPNEDFSYPTHVGGIALETYEQNEVVEDEKEI